MDIKDIVFFSFFLEHNAILTKNMPIYKTWSPDIIIRKKIVNKPYKKIIMHP